MKCLSLNWLTCAAVHQTACVLKFEFPWFIELSPTVKTLQLKALHSLNCSFFFFSLNLPTVESKLTLAFLMATPRSQSSLKRRLPSDSLSTSRVRVVLRVRPFIPSEIETNGKSPTPCISVLGHEHGLDDEVTVHLKDQWTSRNECYKLDSFFGQGDNVGQIFYKEVSGVIPRIFQGMNATIFAYGATGSGKTYTMQGTEEEPGLIPLSMSAILSSSVNTNVIVEVSYYEVYMDRCYDLLEPKAKEIMALDDKDGRVQLKGVSWIEVHTMEEFQEIFSTGVQRRKVAHTGLNDVSSRSHGVLAITVKNGNASGKLNLIDLAGNEDNRRTGNDGIRLQESVKINQSLFALSNVIYALNNNESRIPYRESKLTRILQDSLGGTSQALMVACLNPISYQEAVHTVSLAARSRQIVNYVGSAKKETPKEKVDMEAKLQAWLESKGKKNKSMQRIGPFSPSFGRTPSSVNHSKNSGSVRSSVTTKPTEKGVNTVERKLFDLGVPSTATSAETNSHEVEESKHDSVLHYLPNMSNNGDNQCDMDTVHNKDQWKPSENVFPSEIGFDRDQDDAHMNNCSSVPEDLNYGTTIDCSTRFDPILIKSFPKQISSDVQHRRTVTDAKISKQSDLPDLPYNKENLCSPVNIMGSPSMSEKIQELRHSLRKVLSPIPSNIAANNHQPTDERICIVLFEPKTPKTPCILTCDKDEPQISDTPLDKFDALSSNLKEALVEKYLTFLNVASKEELLQLKGIGQKRAEYILELREQTPNPLKSLSDLEKLGLSSKQVQDMFKRAARGIFA